MNSSSFRNAIRSKRFIGSLTALLLLALAAGLLFAQNTQYTATQTMHNNGRSGNVFTTKVSDSNASMTSPAATIPPSTASQTQTADSLQYIIEEEKLAHDVYEALYQLWGARVFSNIAGSETRHQSEVLAILQSRQIADPRSSVAGQFTNQDLQKLYNTLVAQGSQNITEAYKVGKAIEELDIADITNAINTLGTNDSDIQAMYQTLINGSKNHLSAFNRQLTR